MNATGSSGSKQHTHLTWRLAGVQSNIRFRLLSLRFSFHLQANPMCVIGSKKPMDSVRLLAEVLNVSLD